MALIKVIVLPENVARRLANWLHKIPMKKLMEILCAAILSALPAAAGVKTLPWGIYNLPGVSRTSKPDDPNTWAAWSNSHVAGVCARQSWEQLEQTEGVFSWKYLDAVDANATKSLKYYEITIEAGADKGHQNWPNWLLTDSVPTVTLHDDNGYPVTVPLPWDPTFQAKWQVLVKALGNRYDGKQYFHCVQMTGPGRGGELFFGENGNDYNYLVTHYGSDWPSLWQQAAETIAGFYANYFPSTPFLYSTGRPLPNAIDPNNQTMGTVVSNLNTAYNSGGVWRVGTRDSGYYYGGDPIPWGVYFQGYQQNHAVGKEAGPEVLQVYGSPYNGLWFEVKATDCQDRFNYRDFDTFNADTYDPNQIQ
jgi:hypothetical protein